MCGPISQETYRREYPEQVVGLFTKEGAEPALLTQDRAGDVSIILSLDGSEYKTFWTNKRGRWIPALKQLAGAYTYLDKQGYVAQRAEQEPVLTQAVVPGTVEVATTYNQQAVEDTRLPAGQEFDHLSDSIVVQGRTLKQWDEVGVFNAELPHSEHIHPTIPAGREPTMVEFAAHTNSQTVPEALVSLVALSLAAGESGPLSDEGLSSLLVELTGASA